MSAPDLIQQLQFLECSVEPCGSRVTCVPPPTDTDQDYLVEAPPDRDKIGRLVNALHGLGFRWEGNEHYQDACSYDFMSWRQGETNLIVTSNSDFARRHRAATSVCKRLNLLNKQDRIALFQAVLYGNDWDGESNHPSAPMPKIREEEDPF